MRISQQENFFTMKINTTIAIVTMSLVFSIFACQSFFKSNITPQSSNCQVSTIDKNIIGTWNYISTFSGDDGKGMTHFTGVLSFNNGILTDDNMLLGSIYHGNPIEKKLYDFKKDTLRLITITKVDTVIIKGIAGVNECDKVVFNSWFYLAPSPGLSLTLTRNK